MEDGRSPCSVVLEGGVTSAVIYASLLHQLSRYYTFRQLGGTSSGAVAATAAAAAEYARLHAGDAGRRSFDALGAFPEALRQPSPRGGTVLFQLFQPQREGARSFHVAMAALDPKGRRGLAGAVARTFGALVNLFPVAAIAAASAAAVALGLAWRGCCTAGTGLCIVGGAAAVATVSVGAIVALVAWALRETFRALRENDWGLCNGMPEPEGGDGGLTPTLHRLIRRRAGKPARAEPAGDDGALTPRLHLLIQDLAGKPADAPLTFGELWWGPLAPGASDWQREPERLIDLQIVTTAVSQARPVGLPGRPGSDPLKGYFYDPAQWKRLFPDAILDHLARHAGAAGLQRDDGTMLLALPEPAHWPVLMAARFSLSFPVLLSALPMYIALPRRDVLRTPRPGGPLPFEARKVYFSDGGITSNCPVHLFDAPLPAYPTFGVNLYTLPKRSRWRVSRSDQRDPEIDAVATVDATGWRTPVSLLKAIFKTMFGWRDSLQRSLPGYRERIVHVGVPKGDGGLHLAMSSRTIRRLARLGAVAAGRLHRSFSLPRRVGEPDAWARHRWTRARTTLAALHAYLSAFTDRACSGDPAYRRLLATASDTAHPFASDAARQQALALLDGAQALSRELDATAPPDAPDALDAGAPTPRPDLHLSPPW